MHYSETPRLTQPEEAALQPRPRVYDDDVAYTIIERLADGESLHDICADRAFPHPVTFYRWLGENNEYAQAYDYALLARFDKLAQEIIAIADDAASDFIIETKEDGTPTRKLSPEAIQRTRERIKTRQWYAEKELPRKYGKLPAIVAAPALQQLEAPPPQTDDHVYLARQAVQQLLGPRAITDPE